jgi:glycosyltransferase involved in cell wall biosynthesis
MSSRAGEFFLHADLETVNPPQRILFICAGAEPGGDGVGDYTRRLAAELEKRGHAVAILALNGRSLGMGSRRGDNELHLTCAEPWSIRLREANVFLREFQPDVLSLQFVGYGFDPHGLPLGLTARLRTLAGGIPWHMMFHELWNETGIGWKARVLSRLQKAHLGDLWRSLRPRLVHTSNENYARRLAEAGISSSVLPLFSNIERSAPDPTLRQTLVQGFNYGADSHNVWIFVFFGTIHPGWNVEGFFKRTSEAARRAGKKATLFVSIGKNPGRGAAIWNSMQGFKTESLFFRQIGELSTIDVSRHLQAADFGVATTPLSLLGKSGSAAAMASHGLTTIVPRVDVALSRETTERRGLVLVDEFFEQVLFNPPKPRESHSVSDTADLFLQQLHLLFKTP